MNPEELGRIAVLRELNQEARAHLAGVLEERLFADGTTVFAEGDPGDGMYFIVQGCVRIEKRTQVVGSVPKTLAVLEAGDYVGEMALLDAKPRSAAAVAAGGVRLLWFSKSAFDEIRRHNSAAALSLLFAMVRTSGERIRRLSTHMVVFDEVGKAIGEAHDLQGLLEVILRQLTSATTADWGLLLLRPQFCEGFEVRAEVNLALTAEQREAISHGKGFLGVILGKPQDLLVPEFDQFEPFKSCPRLGFEATSLSISPVSLHERLLGFIILGGHETNQFDLNALNLVRGVARQTAQAILNARHKEEEHARTRHSRQFVRF